MTQSRFFIFLIIFMFFSGCVATNEKRNGLELEKNTLHAANQTLNYSVQSVDEATLRVLDQMEIIIINNNSSSVGNSIKAATVDLDILIELTSLTPNSTQMKIEIQYPNGQKPKSTANEIFYQIRQTLLSNKRVKKTALAKPVELIKKNFPTE